MRAVTLKDGELAVEEHPDPTPGQARSSCAFGRPA